MRRNLRSRSAGPIAVLVAALSLLAATAALAAIPLAGKAYRGLTSGRAVHGWKPSVLFRVSSNGKQLIAFNWHGGCRKIGPIPPSAPPGWIDPGFVHRVGTIKVDPNGNFSVESAKQTDNFGPHGREVTTSIVNGSFTTPKTAAGTINYTMRDYSAKGAFEQKCNGKVSFTAKAA